MKILHRVLKSLLLIVVLTACSGKAFDTVQTPMCRVEQIYLSPPWSDDSSEFSGMAWYGDELILLPQYPNRINIEGKSGWLLAMPREEIETYLQTKSKKELQGQAYRFISQGLEKQIEGFEGYEAIGFSGDIIFLTVEARQKVGMRGFIVSGNIERETRTIFLNPAKVIEILPQTDFSNASDEALIIHNDRVLTFFEDNGLAVNPNPVSHQFNLSLEPMNDVKIPNIEFRLTDASTPVDGTFWVINSFFPGDDHLRSTSDNLPQNPAPEGLRQADLPVERLIKFDIKEDGIRLVPSATILIELEKDATARNWEGLEILNSDGFLIVTDKFPGTIFGFCRILR